MPYHLATPAILLSYLCLFSACVTCGVSDILPQLNMGTNGDKRNGLKNGACTWLKAPFTRIRGIRPCLNKEYLMRPAFLCMLLLITFAGLLTVYLTQGFGFAILNAGRGNKI